MTLPPIDPRDLAEIMGDPEAAGIPDPEIVTEPVAIVLILMIGVIGNLALWSLCWVTILGVPALKRRRALVLRMEPRKASPPLKRLRSLTRCSPFSSSFRERSMKLGAR